MPLPISSRGTPVAFTADGTAMRSPQRSSAERASARRVAGKRNAMHDAAEAVIVVDRIVLCRAVVPEGERAVLPAKAAGEFGTGLVAVEKCQKRCALRLGHSGKSHRMRGIDVKRLAPGFGVDAHDRVLGGEFLAGVIAGARPDAVLAGARDVGFGRA